MPRIPVIEQTSNVSPVTPTPQAQGLQVVSPIGNAGAIAAQGLDMLAEADVRNQNALFHKENADAIANTGKPLSDADVYWKQYLVDTGQKTVDGGMLKNEDGTTIGFRAKAEKDFDSWSTGFLSGITNEKAKIYAQNHINQLRTQTLDNALSYEAKAGIENRTTKVDEAVQTWAGAAAKDDSNVQGLILSAKTMIANAGFDEATRNAKARAATQSIVEAAIHGNIERNPGATRAALIARYGVDPTAPPPATAQPDGSMPADGSVQSQAIGFTLKHEGGLNKADTNGTPSNFGINQAAHPDIDVSKLTQAQAAAIYKKDYWDKIGGDALAAKNPQLAIVAMDTAAMAGVGQANNLLAKAGGDPAKFMDLRESFLQELIAKNPDKYGKYQKAWGDRNADLRAAITPGAGRGLVNPAAVAASPGEPSAPASPAYSPALAALVDQLPPEKLPSYLSAATTQVNQQQALVRSQVATTEGDQVTAFMNGQTVAKPLTQGDYTAAYGPVEGPARYANFQSIQQLGQDITSMKAMPPEQMMNMAERYKPDPNKPGYELATKRYDSILKAIDQVNAARQSDPIAFAMSSGIGGAQPLNFQDQKAFAAELGKRQGVASTMQSTYGAPFALLSKAEATTLQRGFEGMTTQQRLGYLTSIQSSVNDPGAYRSIMQQIAPDSPVTAMAGIILSKQSPMIVRNMISADQVYQQKDVAGIMLEGEALINPTKTAKGEDGKGKTFPMPKEQDIRDQFNAVVGKAFAADPRGADFAYQGVKAYYAGKAAREGDVSGTTNSGILKEAITAVVGGVTDINGKGEVIRPWGMDSDSFKNRTKASFDQAMRDNGFTNTQADNFGIYGLQSAGDSKYMLRAGTGYLTDRTGNPIVLDLTPRKSFAALIPTNADTAPGAASITPPGTVKPEKTDKPVTQQPKTK